MFDLHCHILYGVDDGSETLEESVRMAKIAADGGTRGIVATPHCNIPGSYQNLWKSSFKEKIILLNQTLIKNKIPVTVFLGQEIFCCGNFTELLEKGKLITINGSKYVLSEFDFTEKPDSVYKKLKKLVAIGVVPIVAHPERYGFVQEDESSLVQMKNIGALLQLNKGSFNGDFGHGARRLSETMLAGNLADFVASDAHGPYTRNTDLSDEFEEISERYSSEYAKILFESNPERVLRNQDI